MLTRCYAKINLYLKVVSRREDGYHNIESIFQNVSLFDILRIEKSTSFSLKLDTESNIETVTGGYDLRKGNILEEVYEYFRTEFGVPPVELVLTKNIPVGAGLGGGSSDAAGLIMGLDRMCGLDLGVDALTGIAERFGADIPFFIRGGTARVEGIGDVITPLSTPYRLNCLLVYPGIHVSTMEAYKIVNIGGRETCIDDLLDLLTADHLSGGGITKLAEKMYNSFQDVMCTRYAHLNDLILKLKEHSPATLMSGSGSSIFAVFNENENATEAYRSIQREYPSSWLVRDVPQGVLLQE